MWSGSSMRVRRAQLRMSRHARREVSWRRPGQTRDPQRLDQLVNATSRIPLLLIGSPTPRLARRVEPKCDLGTATVAVAVSSQSPASPGNSIEVCEGPNDHHCLLSRTRVPTVAPPRSVGRRSTVKRVVKRAQAGGVRPTPGSEPATKRSSPTYGRAGEEVERSEKLTGDVSC